MNTSHQAKPNQARSGRTRPGKVSQSQTRLYQTKKGKTGPEVDLARSNQTNPSWTRPDQVVALFRENVEDCTGNKDLNHQSDQQVTRRISMKIMVRKMLLCFLPSSRLLAAAAVDHLPVTPDTPLHPIIGGQPEEI